MLPDTPSWGAQHEELFRLSDQELLDHPTHTFDSVIDTFQSFHVLYPLLKVTGTSGCVGWKTESLPTMVGV